MTWRTQIGERTLVGAEAELIKLCLKFAVDALREDREHDIGGWSFGIRIFDDLPVTAKLRLLADVGWSLLRETPECPPLTAISEGTVGVLFEWLDDMLRVELDDFDGSGTTTNIRSAILAAAREARIDTTIRQVSSEDVEEWVFLTESLAERILWDDDFRSASLFLDAPPDVADAMKSMLTIDEEYFRAVPPDPRDSELPGILKRLEELCAGVC